MTVTDEADTYVLFELAGAAYGVRSVDVQQLEMVTTITPVPNSPPYVRGVVSVRGVVIPVVDLRARFSFASVEPGLKTRLLVVRNGGRTVALMVDTAREFARIAEDAIEPPPAAVSGLSGRYLRGIASHADRIVLILDMAELLDAQFDLQMPPTEDTNNTDNLQENTQ
jgi:purine-binding chemotaxis protein CheW